MPNSPTPSNWKQWCRIWSEWIESRSSRHWFGAFNHESFLIKFIIEQIILGRLSITGIRADVGDDFMALQRSPEGLGVKSYVGIVEKSFGAQTAFPELRCQLIDPLFNLIEIRVVAFLRLGHCQRQPLSVAEIQGVGCLAFLLP